MEIFKDFQIFFILGKVDLEELISAFMDLGIEMDKSEAKNLLLRYVFKHYNILFITTASSAIVSMDIFRLVQ